MSVLTSIIIVLGFIIVYMFLIQVYTVLFRITGLTKEKSHFQAISLLTGCGFTTGESEVVTSDKLRRKIAIAAMLTGYSFSVVIVSLIINLIENIKGEDVKESLMWIGMAFAGFILIFIIFQLPFVKKAFEKLIEFIATNLLKRNQYENVITLLDNYGKDAIAEVYINKLPDFLVEKTVLESRIKDKYHVNVLMVKRNGKAMDVTKDTIFKKKDSLVVFGSVQGIKACFTKTKVETEKNVIVLIEEYGEEAMAEISLNRIPEFLLNKGLFESGLKSKYSINLLSIKRKDSFLPISKDTILEAHDTIVVFGPYDHIRDAFAEKETDEV